MLGENKDLVDGEACAFPVFFVYSIRQNMQIVNKENLHFEFFMNSYQTMRKILFLAPSLDLEHLG